MFRVHTYGYIIHKSRLIKNKHLQFKPSSLWKYQSYNIEYDNQKNFKEYVRYCNLFPELLDVYKKYEDVKSNYCRYAFCTSCNLLKWMENYDIKGRKYFRTPLSKTLNKYYISCIENEPPAEFDPYHIYGISKLEEFTYYDLYLDELIQVDNPIRHFMYEDIDYLIDFMKYIYVDQSKISTIIQETYEKAQLEPLFPQAIPIPYRLMYVYDQYCMITDEILNCKILATFKKVLQKKTMESGD